MVALLFIAILSALTIADFVRYGVTALGVVAAAVLIVVGIGVVGALRNPPRE